MRHFHVCELHLLEFIISCLAELSLKECDKVTNHQILSKQTDIDWLCPFYSGKRAKIKYITHCGVCTDKNAMGDQNGRNIT